MRLFITLSILLAASQARAEYYCNNSGTDLSGTDIEQANARTEGTLDQFQQKYGAVSITKIEYGFYCESLIQRIAFEWNGQRCSAAGSDVMCNGKFVIGPLVRFNGNIKKPYHANFDSSETDPVVEQVGWEVVRREGNVVYNPPVIQRRRGHVLEQYTSSPEARHLNPGCRLVSRQGNVVYDPPRVQCRSGNVMIERPSTQLVPGLPF
jgi:hypothetical protein